MTLIIFNDLNPADAFVEAISKEENARKAVKGDYSLLIIDACHRKQQLTFGSELAKIFKLLASSECSQ